MPRNPAVTIDVRANTRQMERQIVSGALQAQRTISSRPIPIHADTKNASQALGRISGQANEFNKSLAASTARVVAFGVSVGIVRSITESFKELLLQTRLVEKSLVDINVIFGASSSDLEKFGSRLFGVAQKTAQSFATVTEAAVEFSRQGLSMEETLIRTRDALILTRISGLDAAQSVQTLTAAVNGFGQSALNTTEIINKFAIVDAGFAVSAKDLADSLARAGSAAQDANISFDELLALTTAVQQRTARGGAVIGNAFKTIFARIQSSSRIDQLKSLGVEIDATQTGMQKLLAISTSLDSKDVLKAAKIRELLGGVRQVNIVSAVVRDLSKEYSIFNSALSMSLGATDDAIRRNENLNQTLDTLAKQGVLGLQKALAKLGDIGIGDNLKTIVAVFNGVINSFNNTLDGEGIGSDFAKGFVRGVSNVLSGPVLIALGIILVRILRETFVFAKDVVKSMGVVNGATSQQIQLQKSIGDVLKRNSGEYLLQLRSSKSAASQQEVLLKILQKEILAQQVLNREMLNYSRIAVTAGFRRGAGGVLSVKSRGAVPTAAEGILPAVAEEFQSVRSGIGGARPSDKPRVIPSFDFGGGKRGPIVAHSGEKVVENFMGSSGSAVFNRDMINAAGGITSLKKFGNVRNVASGVIPNLAGLPPIARRSLIQDAWFKKESGLGANKLFAQKPEEAILLASKFGNKVFPRMKSNVGMSSFVKSVDRSSRPDDIVDKIRSFGFANGIIPNLARFEGLTRIVKTIKFNGQKAVFSRRKSDDEFESFLKRTYPGIGPQAIGKFYQQGQKYEKNRLFNQVHLARKGHGVEILGKGEGGSFIAKRAKMDVQDAIDRGLITQREAKIGIDARLGAMKKDGLKLFDARPPNFSFPDFKVLDAGGLRGIKRAAAGQIPEFATVLGESVQREVGALRGLGVSPSDASNAIRVGSNATLKNSANPQGLGVFNSLQENSLQDALVAHRGENVKFAGAGAGAGAGANASNGLIPNLVGGFSTKNLTDIEVQNVFQQLNKRARETGGKIRDYGTDIKKARQALNGLTNFTGDTAKETRKLSRSLANEQRQIRTRQKNLPGVSQLASGVRGATPLASQVNQSVIEGRLKVKAAIENNRLERVKSDFVSGKISKQTPADARAIALQETTRSLKGKGFSLQEIQKLKNSTGKVSRDFFEKVFREANTSIQKSLKSEKEAATRKRGATLEGTKAISTRISQIREDRRLTGVQAAFIEGKEKGIAREDFQELTKRRASSALSEQGFSPSEIRKLETAPKNTERGKFFQETSREQSNLLARSFKARREEGLATEFQIKNEKELTKLRKGGFLSGLMGTDKRDRDRLLKQVGSGRLGGEARRSVRGAFSQGQEARSGRGSTFGFGAAFLAPLVGGFFDQVADRTEGATSKTATVAGSAAQGIGYGALFGKKGVIGIGLIGLGIGLVKALDPMNKSVKDFSKEAESAVSAQNKVTNSIQEYMKVQDKFNSILESGADITAQQASVFQQTLETILINTGDAGLAEKFRKTQGNQPEQEEILSKTQKELNKKRVGSELDRDFAVLNKTSGFLILSADSVQRDLLSGLKSGATREEIDPLIRRIVGNAPDLTRERRRDIGASFTKAQAFGITEGENSKEVVNELNLALSKFGISSEGAVTLTNSLTDEFSALDFFVLLERVKDLKLEGNALAKVLLDSQRALVNFKSEVGGLSRSLNLTTGLTNIRNNAVRDVTLNRASEQAKALAPNLSEKGQLDLQTRIDLEGVKIKRLSQIEGAEEDFAKALRSFLRKEGVQAKSKGGENINQKILEVLDKDSGAMLAVAKEVGLGQVKLEKIKNNQILQVEKINFDATVNSQKFVDSNEIQTGALFRAQKSQAFGGDIFGFQTPPALANFGRSARQSRFGGVEGERGRRGSTIAQLEFRRLFPSVKGAFDETQNKVSIAEEFDRKSSGIIQSQLSGVGKGSAETSVIQGIIDSIDQGGSLRGAISGAEGRVSEESFGALEDIARSAEKLSEQRTEIVNETFKNLFKADESKTADAIVSGMQTAFGDKFNALPSIASNTGETSLKLQDLVNLNLGKTAEAKSADLVNKAVLQLDKQVTTDFAMSKEEKGFLSNEKADTLANITRLEEAISTLVWEGPSFTVGDAMESLIGSVITDNYGPDQQADRKVLKGARALEGKIKIEKEKLTSIGERQIALDKATPLLKARSGTAADRSKFLLGQEGLDPADKIALERAAAVGNATVENAKARLRIRVKEAMSGTESPEIASQLTKAVATANKTRGIEPETEPSETVVRSIFKPIADSLQPFTQSLRGAFGGNNTNRAPSQEPVPEAKAAKLKENERIAQLGKFLSSFKGPTGEINETRLGNLSPLTTASTVAESGINLSRLIRQAKMRIDISPTLTDEERKRLIVDLKEIAFRANKDLKLNIKVDFEKDVEVLSTIEQIKEGLGQGFQLLKADLEDTSEIEVAWSNVASTISEGLSEAVVSSAQDFKRLKSEGISVFDAMGDSFRQMLSDMFSDLSQTHFDQAFGEATSGVGTFIGGLFGNSKASSGIVDSFNNGGGTRSGVPALVTGGEFAFDPQAVSFYGKDFMESLNRGEAKIDGGILPNLGGVQGSAFGGMLEGGSGTKDDLLGNFPAGTFILKKDAVNRYGKGALETINNRQFAAGGQIERAFLGALLGSVFSQALVGAGVGGLTAAVTGEDIGKGALMGGIGGAITGGVSGIGGALSGSAPSGGGFLKDFGSSFGNTFSGVGNLFGGKGGDDSGTSSLLHKMEFAGTDTPAPFSVASLGKDPFGGSISTPNMADISDMKPTTISGKGNKTGLFGKFGEALLPGLLSLGASALLAPSPPPTEESVIQGKGSITRVRPDGTVSIEHHSSDGAGRVENHKLGQDMSVEQLNKWLSSQGAAHYVPNETPSFAGGGMIDGIGSASFRDGDVLSGVSKQFTTSLGMPSKTSASSLAPLMMSSSEASNPDLLMGATNTIRQSNGLSPISNTVSNSFSSSHVFSPSNISTFNRGGNISNLTNTSTSMRTSTPIRFSDPSPSVRGFASGGAVSPIINSPRLSVSAPSAPMPSTRVVRANGFASGGVVGGSTSSPLAAPAAAPMTGGGGDTNVEINISFGGGGKGGNQSAPDGKGDEDTTNTNTLEGRAFSGKLKQLVLEFIREEKRPGGSLNKNSSKL